ncbi:DUF805 domain-containing protein [Streptomyces zingiberis]|uniref:DUF805 domain-containing protein n=1 Tax=Streptomyces zingiberis TaxID=2053010 RepID=A0ABX1C026_9ACTN|nr:DUF805 domain-containing protein [Streptomyces zingiberis]NJQ03271.1 DUF805 domain-containing protein [Streptomyces zingiberis]
MTWYLLAFRKYAVFTGRAHRKEFWMFWLVSFAVGVLLYVLERALSIDPVLTGLYLAVVFVPSLSASARRLHDTGRSGWWQLINLVPLVGGIILTVLLALRGTEGENAYGPARTAAIPAGR